MENAREYTMRVLKKYEFRTKKSLGQNFLIDDRIIDSIVSNVPEGAVAFEIGPGIGILTRKLVERARRVVAVEIDEKLCEILKEEIDSDALEVIDADFIEINPNSILSEKAVAVANIPYYITTPIIFKILTSTDMIDTAILTMQKEVSERVVARPGGKEYGILSLVAALYSEPKVLFNISRDAFIPQPKVESSVVRFDKRKLNLEVDESDFLKVVRAAFGKRRKTIANALAGIFNGEKGELKEHLMEIGINPMARPETLSLKEFESITGIIFKKS
ncbi:MAG: 16S rRNA (adenine(1518)-N(6)/adenine(1519)-N(6))-dimethyltransferase RsmA [Thermoanaerobacteraceae bacterium]|nr:16S rRNA (adenine(1518)-N(6)/adenine(1519)-N(6))-dimethyltransferase RsmA [Thermoanaerobacteraceae bacterium]